MYTNNQTLIRINRNVEKNGRQTGETDRPKKKELQVQQVRSTGGCQREKKRLTKGRRKKFGSPVRWKQKWVEVEGKMTGNTQYVREHWRFCHSVELVSLTA